MNLARCSTLTIHTENRVWFRAIQTQHLPSALRTKQTVRLPSRYNPASEGKPTFPILYLAENHQVALFEVEALLGSAHGSFVPNPHQAWAILNVQVNLQAVVDLTLPKEQAKIKTSAQELTGDWEGYAQRQPFHSIPQPTGPAPTQRLGATLWATPRVEGFRTISAVMPTHMNLIVFPSKLQKGSRITFLDPGSGRRHTITSKRPRGQNRR